MKNWKFSDFWQILSWKFNLIIFANFLTYPPKFVNYSDNENYSKLVPPSSPAGYTLGMKMNLILIMAFKRKLLNFDLKNWKVENQIFQYKGLHWNSIWSAISYSCVEYILKVLGLFQMMDF